jgi:hypothetical protein
VPPAATPPPGPRAERDPAVVYILGAGRSGSTLLERVLGCLPGFVNVGELVGLFRRIVVQDQRCGCGEPFSGCPFWQEVGRRGFGGWDPEAVRDVAALQDRVARQRNVVRLAVPAVAGAAYRAELARYEDVQRRLYRAIAEAAGADVVVDSSKWPAPALALRHAAGLDLRVLHLVRDVRGVAYSWAKSDVARPHVTTDGAAVMSRFSAGLTAARWTLVEAEAAWLTRATERAATVRYEDLVEHPRETLARTLAGLGFSPALGDHLRIEGGLMTLPSSHGIGGNPSRFTTGDVRLRVDDAWRTRLSRRDAALTTAIGLGPLLGHRYLPQRPTSDRPRS